MKLTTTLMDSQYKVTLPQEIQEFGWCEWTPLDITLLHEGVVVITARRRYCKLCGAESGRMATVNYGSICESCLGYAVKCVK